MESTFSTNAIAWTFDTYVYVVPGDSALRIAAGVLIQGEGIEYEFCLQSNQILCSSSTDVFFYLFKS